MGAEASSKASPGATAGGHPAVSQGAWRGGFTMSPQRGGVGGRCLEEEGLKLPKLEQSSGGSSPPPHFPPSVRLRARCSKM